MAVAGSTITFGTIRCVRSTAEIATRTQQKNEAMTASKVSPNTSTDAATSTAAVTSTAGYSRPIGVRHERQRPRSRTYETTGRLSYQAIGAAQLMQAEPGCTIERCRGTRAARTLRKLPSARPGANATAASARFTKLLSAKDYAELNDFLAPRAKRPEAP